MPRKPAKPPLDDNETAAVLLRGVTGSRKVKDGDLLASPAVRKLVREGKKRLK